MTLTQKFLLTVVGAMVALVVVLGWLVSTSVSSYVMDRNSGSTALYMETFLEPHVQSMVAESELSSADFQALLEVSQQDTLRQHVLSIKVWAPDGRVVFATDPNIVGRQFPTDELVGPLGGQIEAHLDQLEDDENAFERQFNTPIFEIYVPLRSLSDGSVIAVGEFYEDATKLKTYLGQAALQNWAILTVGALAFLGALYFFFRQGNQTIIAQTAAIDRLEGERQDLLSENATVEDRLTGARAQLGDIEDLIRRRIGQELHDGPAQLLGYLMLSVEDLTQVQNLGHHDSDLINAVQQAAGRAQKEIRDISNRLLRPDPGADPEDRISLRTVIDDYEARSNVSVTARGVQLCELLPLPDQRAIARIVNEALNNGFKHANGVAQSVTVLVRSGGLVIEISDGGPGLPDPAELAQIAAAGHQGLPGMVEHAKGIGATLDFDSDEGQHTIVRITLPIS